MIPPTPQRRSLIGSLAARVSRGAIVATVLLMGVVPAWGQPVPQPAPPSAPVVTIGRSWYLEAFIVVVMVGLALFVVCRSARRN